LFIEIVCRDRPSRSPVAIVHRDRPSASIERTVTA
jgi:hypothetical protein